MGTSKKRLFDRRRKVLMDSQLDTLLQVFSRNSRQLILSEQYSLRLLRSLICEQGIEILVNKRKRPIWLVPSSSAAFVHWLIKEGWEIQYWTEASRAWDPCPLPSGREVGEVGTLSVARDLTPISSYEKSLLWIQKLNHEIKRREEL